VEIVEDVGFDTRPIVNGQEQYSVNAAIAILSRLLRPGFGSQTKRAKRSCLGRAAGNSNRYNSDHTGYVPLLTFSYLVPAA
jgi:hypothetical protein